MSEKIAVILDANGAPAPLTRCASICVFEKAENRWNVIEELLVRLDLDGGISEIRAELTEMARALGDCRIIAGLSVNGIAFNVFDKLGFKIFEIAALGPAVLDGISAELLQEEAQEDSKPVCAAPVETELPGYYELDLISLQRAHPEISSKKALRSFLSAVPFISLTLRCSHLPPWLELERSVEIASTLDNDTVVSVIRKKACT